MSDYTSPLPGAVLEALKWGDKIEAVKLLHADGIGLKEAKDAIDAHLRGEAVHLPHAAPAKPLSAAVVHEIAAGRTIAAITLLREETGLGLKDAKDQVEHHARQYGYAAKSESTAPGAQSGPNPAVWLGLLGILAVIAFLLWR